MSIFRILSLLLLALGSACRSAPPLVDSPELVDLHGPDGGPALLARVVHAGQRLETRGQTQRLRFGTQLTLELVDTDTRRPLFVVDTLLPTRSFAAALPGWRAPALHPVWGVILSEYKNPPRLPPYLRWLWVDPVTGDVRELGRHPGATIDAAAALSGDGRWLTFTDARGRQCRLNLTHHNALSRCSEPARVAQTPPVRSGGDAKDSQANRDRRARIRALAALYRQGLIDVEVYRQRRDLILGEGWGTP